jgi:hypothetical protein
MRRPRSLPQVRCHIDAAIAHPRIVEDNSLSCKSRDTRRGSRTR